MSYKIPKPIGLLGRLEEHKLTEPPSPYTGTLPLIACICGWEWGPRGNAYVPPHEPGDQGLKHLLSTDEFKRRRAVEAGNQPGEFHAKLAPTEHSFIKPRFGREVHWIDLTDDERRDAYGPYFDTGRSIGIIPDRREFTDRAEFVAYMKTTYNRSISRNSNECWPVRASEGGPLAAYKPTAPRRWRAPAEFTGLKTVKSIARTLDKCGQCGMIVEKYMWRNGTEENRARDAEFRVWWRDHLDTCEGVAP